MSEEVTKIIKNNIKRKSLLMGLALLLLFVSSSKKSDGLITVLSTVAFSINGPQNNGNGFFNAALGPSRLTKTATFEDFRNRTPRLSEDYLINGMVRTNCGPPLCDPTRILMRIDQNRITLYNGVSEIKVDLRPKNSLNLVFNNVGGLLSTLPWRANVEVVGDIDESSIDKTDLPGRYIGTATIIIISP